MSKENGQDRIAALEAELARIQSERALMDARIRTAQLEAPSQTSRRGDVLAWGAFFVAAALVASLLVTVAQQQPVVHERTRVETVIVPEVATAEAAPVAPTPEATPEMGTPRRPSDRERPSRTDRPTMTDLLGEDRCGNDPTCGI